LFFFGFEQRGTVPALALDAMSAFEYRFPQVVHVAVSNDPCGWQIFDLLTPAAYSRPSMFWL